MNALYMHEAPPGDVGAEWDERAKAMEANNGRA